MMIPDEDLHKVEAQRLNVSERQQKIQEDMKRKEEKIRIMKEIKEQKELEGCTFAPQRITKMKSIQPEEKRDLNKFLEDQKKYEVMKQ